MPSAHADAAVTTTPPAPPELEESVPVRILLVDDEPNNLLALHVVLEGPDRVLVQASSGREACRNVLASDFSVIVLDVNMPGMDGFETAELIRSREQSRHTPIIFLTAGNGDSEQMARGYALGAVDYLFKPFDAESLRAKVAVFVELAKKTEQVKQQAQALADKARLEGALMAIRTAEHELGNQLAGISGLLQMACRSGGIEPGALARVESALQRTGDAAATVQRMRHLTELKEIDWGLATGPTLDLSR